MPRSERGRPKSKRHRKKPYEMTEVEENGNLEKFVTTGRTGRRNALPDIMDEKVALTETGSLSLDIDSLKCSSENEPDKSSPNSNSGTDKKTEKTNSSDTKDTPKENGT